MSQDALNFGEMSTTMEPSTRKAVTAHVGCTVIKPICQSKKVHG